MNARVRRPATRVRFSEQSAASEYGPNWGSAGTSAASSVRNTPEGCAVGYGTRHCTRPVDKRSKTTYSLSQVHIFETASQATARVRFGRHGAMPRQEEGWFGPARCLPSQPRPGRSGLSESSGNCPAILVASAPAILAASALTCAAAVVGSAVSRPWTHVPGYLAERRVTLHAQASGSHRLPATCEHGRTSPNTRDFIALTNGLQETPQLASTGMADAITPRFPLSWYPRHLF
jgi:hypothetical protein